MENKTITADIFRLNIANFLAVVLVEDSSAAAAGYIAGVGYIAEVGYIAAMGYIAEPHIEGVAPH